MDHSTPHLTSPCVAEQPVVSKRRWLVVALFALVLCSNQMQVSFLIPQQTQVQLQYGLSELESSLSILIIPLLCILFSIPCGRLIDHLGFRRGAAMGGALLALSLLFRIDNSFASLMAGQVLIGLSQPMLMNGISRMAIEWFDEPERATAIGISTAGLFLGLAAGLGLPPLLVAAFGITQALLLTGLVGLIPAALLWLISKQAVSTLRTNDVGRHSLVQLFRTAGMLPVLTTAVVGCSLFNALALSLEPMLNEHGLGPETLSAAGALMILGGVAGSLFIARIAQALGGKFRALAGCGVVVIPLLCLLYYATAPAWVVLCATLLGAFLLPGYALLIAMSEEAAGQHQAAQANALITLAGNLGAGTGIGLAALLHTSMGQWAYVIAFLIALAVIQTVIVTSFASLRSL
jgi:predicted MFS family arabinose efflux permease